MWQAPHVVLPSSATAVLVAAAFPPFAVVASALAFVSRLLAFPSNSAHFCQISGLAREVAGFLTPVPGGVGPVTVAMLLRNTLRAAGARI